MQLMFNYNAGLIPRVEALDLRGSDNVGHRVATALQYNPSKWKEECVRVSRFLDSLGDGRDASEDECGVMTRLRRLLQAIERNEVGRSQE